MEITDKYVFTLEKTTIEEIEYSLDYGLHYFKIEVDEEFSFYRVEVVKDEGGKMFDYVSFLKVKNGFETALISKKDEHHELPYPVERFLTGKFKGEVISEKEFTAQLEEAIKSIKSI